jgi:hypothetical protein
MPHGLVALIPFHYPTQTTTDEIENVGLGLLAIQNFDAGAVDKTIQWRLEPRAWAGSETFSAKILAKA